MSFNFTGKIKKYVQAACTIQQRLLWSCSFEDVHWKRNLTCQCVYQRCAKTTISFSKGSCVVRDHLHYLLMHTQFYKVTPEKLSMIILNQFFFLFLKDFSRSGRYFMHRFLQLGLNMQKHQWKQCLVILLQNKALKTFPTQSPLPSSLLVSSPLGLNSGLLFSPAGHLCSYAFKGNRYYSIQPSSYQYTVDPSICDCNYYRNNLTLSSFRIGETPSGTFKCGIKLTQDFLLSLFLL